jgi:heptosyltransferase-2
MKFLLIRLSSIGDVVLTTPVIRCLKTQVKDAEVHYLVAARYKEILMANPYIHAIHTVEQLNYGLIDELKAEGFHAIIDLQNEEASTRIRAELDLPSFILKHRSVQKSIFTSVKLNLLPRNEHVVDRYMRTVASFGVKNDGAGLDHFIPVEQEVTEKDIPASHHLGFIALVIGASFYTKRLPVAQLQDLCASIDHPVILLGGKEDAHAGRQVSAADTVKLYNACGKFSLHESADLIRRSKLVIAPDTGMMHIAAALKKQVIAIWGSTVPALGMWPYYGEQHLARQPDMYDHIQVNGLWCRPCTTIGRTECPLGHFKCMKKMDMGEVAGRVEERLRGKR